MLILPTIDVIVVEKLTSSLIACANSFNVFNKSGALSTILLTSSSTYFFEAACVLFTGVCGIVMLLLNVTFPVNEKSSALFAVKSI